MGFREQCKKVAPCHIRSGGDTCLGSEGDLQHVRQTARVLSWLLFIDLQLMELYLVNLFTVFYTHLCIFIMQSTIW